MAVMAIGFVIRQLSFLGKRLATFIHARIRVLYMHTEISYARAEVLYVRREIQYARTEVLYAAPKIIYSELFDVSLRSKVLS